MQYLGGKKWKSEFASYLLISVAFMKPVHLELFMISLWMSSLFLYPYKESVSQPRYAISVPETVLV